MAADALKQSVQRHWELEPCGTRGADPAVRHAYFTNIEQHRYAVEPHIPAFADFEAARGSRVLEIGVGAGTDHVNWLRSGARAFGIDLTMSGVSLTRERAELEGIAANAFVADAEALPFQSNVFDIVYSFGVLHHTPDTQRAIEEVHRTLKPGGTAKVMIYHRPSVVGFLLWLYYCAGRLKPWRSATWAVFHHLESPGTKAYTLDEARRLFSKFRTVTVKSQLGPGDLLTVRPSTNYSSTWIQLAWRLYPRWIIRRLFGDRFGLELLVQAVK
jgi:ubiquinone/menaquinone biosynthesis C-methylase UbiE